MNRKDRKMNKLISILLAFAMIMQSVSGTVVLADDTQPEVLESTQAMDVEDTEEPEEVQLPQEEQPQETEGQDASAKEETDASASGETEISGGTQITGETQTSQEADIAEEDQTEEIFTDHLMDDPMPAAEEGLTEINLSTVSVEQVYLLTNAQFVSTSAGDILTGTGKGYRLTGSGQDAGTRTVYVGDNTYNGNPYSGQQDISVDLAGTGSELSVLQINPIAKGDGGFGSVRLSVSKNSRIGTLKLMENAQAVLALSNALEIGNMELAAGSSLTIQAGSYSFTVTESTTGSGSIALSGSNLVFHDLDVGSITLDTAVMNASGCKVAAKDNLTVNSSTVQNASLLGFKEDVTVARILSFTGAGNALHNIEAVGTTENGTANVSITGAETISNASDTNFICDYGIIYLHDETKLEKEDTWPDTYRVKYKGTISGTGEMIGYHQASGTYVGTADQIQLPVYVQKGYTCEGWTCGEDSTVNTVLPSGYASDLTFHAVMKAASVSVTTDLGYDPDEYSNDDYTTLQRRTTQEYNWGDVVTLSTPYRFGYQFQGWKIQPGDEKSGLIKDCYTVSLDDATESEDGTFSIALTAVWEADRFPVRFLISSNVDLTKLKVQTNDTTVYDSVSDFAQSNQYVTWNEADHLLEFDHFVYGEKLSDYLKGIGLSQLPVLLDQREGEAKQEFAGWSTPSGAMLLEDMTFSVGSILDSKGEGESLADYQAKIKNTPILLSSLWGTGQYKLTVDVVDGWELLVNGQVQTPKGSEKTMTISVTTGSELVWRCSATKPLNFSRWTFTEGFLPEETTYDSGANYLTWKAVMPYRNIKASYTSDLSSLYVDLSVSKITFEEKVTMPNGRTEDGFWYTQMMTPSEYDGMKVNALSPAFQANASYVGHQDEYFYVWDYGDTFQITSKNTDTQNQLTLVSAMTITLKDCKMIATDAYRDQAAGTKLGEIELENLYDDQGKNMSQALANTNLTQYANVVLDTDKTNLYTVYLNLKGDNNVIADISTSGFHAEAKYGGTVYVQGIDKGNSKAVLGTIFGDFSCTIQKLDVTAYAKETPFRYLTYTSRVGSVYFNQSRIQAKDRIIFTYSMYMNVADSQLYVREARGYYYGINISGASYAHIYGDVLSNRHSMSVKGSSSVVIDGNVLTTNQDQYASGDINTSGYVIVKGTVYDASNTRFTNGTVICNTLIVGSYITTNGSARLITNLITTNTYSNIQYDKVAGRYYPSLNSSDRSVYSIGKADQNEDDYPFRVFSSSVATTRTYSFGGASTRIYLFGSYKTTPVNGVDYYDLSITAMDEDNPIQGYVLQCLDDNGELKSQVSLDDTALQNSVKAASGYANNECMMLGNSTYIPGTNTPRFVAFTGAQVYAAGNLTFFNETTVSDGLIWCGGSFGTKSDLTVSGGQVTAKTVGNVYHLNTVYADATKRWKKTLITGGTVNADEIGARASHGTKGSIQRSLVEITGGTIQGKTTQGNATIQSDEYINYIYDNTDFPEDSNTFASMPDNVRLTAQDTDGTTKNWHTEDKISFALPVAADGNTGSWQFGSLSGPEATGIAADGSLLPDESNINVSQKDQLLLYAAKDKYNLTQVYGTDLYTLTTKDDQAVFTSNTMTDISDLQQIEVRTASVSGGTELTLRVQDELYRTRTVVWYIDGNGQYHNALAGKSWQGDSITFDMPKGNTYIYVVDDEHALPLDLWVSSYSFDSKGFVTQLVDVDSFGKLTDTDGDKSFTYSGNYRIVQSNLKNDQIKDSNGTALTGVNAADMTSNRIRFASDFDNQTVSGNQMVLSRIYQKCQDDQFGVLVESSSDGSKGGKVKLELDGKVALFRFQLKYPSSIALAGMNGKDTDVLYFNRAQTNSPSDYLINAGTITGMPGNLTLEDLKLNYKSGYGGYLLYGTKRGGSLTIKDCTFKNKAWGDSTGFARYVENIKIQGSDIDITNGYSYTTELFSGCGDVTVSGKSTIRWKSIGSESTGGYPFDYGIGGTLTVDDSEIITDFDPSADTRTYIINDYETSKAKQVILKNGAKYTADSRLWFTKVQVLSDAVLTVKSLGSEESYFLSKDILVDGGTINADYVVVSGFYSPQSSVSIDCAATKAVLDLRISKQTNVINGNASSGLVIQSGTVNARKFAGGDWNGKVTVSGGTLNTAAVGTSGYLYGFIKQLPANKLDYVYKYPIYNYSNYQQSAAVTINGGTVNIENDGYLGGANTTVQVSGGQVNLGENAVLGMTQEQTKALSDYYSAKGDSIGEHVPVSNIQISGGSIAMKDDAATGSICAPYGQIQISGNDTSIKAAKISADYGIVEIRETKNAFDNPYQGNESSIYKSNRIGVWVTDSLSAQNLIITDGAQVYAPNAFAQITDGQGRLSVQKAGLYSAAYGEKGISRAEDDKQYNDRSGALDQTVFGTHLVSITYVLNPQGILLDADEKLVNNENPENYTSTATDQQLLLKDGFCEGYYFRGWYNNPECTGSPATQINTTVANDFTLYAKWEKVKVKFQLRMDESSAAGYYNEAEFAGNSHWTKAEDGNSYVSSEMAYVTYGDRILTASGVNLINYSTNTLGVTEVQIQEDGYTGDQSISASSTVTKALAEYYKTKDTSKDGSAVITLHVHLVQKRYATITFDLNQKNGRPVDAAFTTGVSAIRENVGVDKTLGTIPAFTDTSVTQGNSKGLVQAAAKGYTFYGWNTDKDATKDSADGWVDKDSIFTANTTIYAIWQVNTYKVQFLAGEGSWVTAGQQAPSAGQTPITSLECYWVYDTPVTEENSFWYKDAQENRYMTELPYAWKEGSTFDNENGWFYSYAENGTTVKEKISSAKALSALLIRTLDVTLGSPYGNPDKIALSVTAEYTPVNVTYDLNGGHWTDNTQASTQNPAYGAPLAGYHTEDADNSTTQVLESTTGENGTIYRVLGTTAEYFNANKQYAAADYRNLLSKKGYTFLGWYTSLEDAEKAEADPNAVQSVGTTPRFADVNLYAAWKANTYQVDLYSKDAGKTYNYTSFNQTDPVIGISVTVGQKIASQAWPSRDGNWYAYNNSTTGTPEENAKRFFLGGTFAALDPGTTDQANTAGYKTYQNYAEAVTAMSNSGTLYQEGSSLFFLPEDDAYSKDITANYGNNYTVPDYPDGSTISMYAIYRERSLVFVERYIDPAGQEQQTIKYSGPWNVWSDYPAKYGTEGNPLVTKQGYSLVGWYVNGPTTTAEIYPSTKADYDAKSESFKAVARERGTYDIMVYTVYAAQVNRNVAMNSKTDPVTTDLTVDSYTLPASMQNGKVTMSLTMGSPVLQLVSKEEMEAHAYDPAWTTDGVQYSAENTAALLVTLSKGADTKTMDLSKAANGTLDFEKEIEAGWQVTLTLYHSKVISADHTYTFDLKMNFASSGSGENTLKDQFINNHVSVRLQPTIYTVNYSVQLPEKAGLLTVGSWGDFTQPDDTDAVEVTGQVKQAYGSDLISNLIQIEGYKPASDLWIYENSTDAYKKADMKVSAANNGQIDVALSYQAKTWRLTADADTLKYWTITYSDGVGSNDVTELTSAGADVKYHSDIRFTPNGNGYDYAPEFVTITRTPDDQSSLQYKLPDYAQKATDGSYEVQMNAAALAATYVTVMTMYLEEGTITLTPDAYTQERAEGTVTKTWPGTYVVLQNRQNSGANATANRLIIDGNLDGREIALGNLNISSNNSVELKANTKAALTMGYDGQASTLTGKNILAPGGSDVQLMGNSTVHGAITLTPGVGDAAIGGTAAQPANGTLTMTDLDISLNMPAGSSASGIGAATDGTGAGDISISNCTVNVSEGSDVAVYSGAWIGGKDVQNVDLANVTLAKNGDKHMAGPSITKGKKVTIVSCKLGSADSSLTDPVYGEDTLTITNSEIYLNLQDNISGKEISAPVGSSSTGSVTVTNSKVKAICTGNGINGISDLYTGILYIKDAVSDVNVDGTQILEMTNGSVTINGNSYIQADNSHAADNARKDYLLIQEGTKTGVPDLTVSQIGGTLEVRTPKNTANTSVDVGNLAINTDTQLQLKGMLTVSGTATVSANTAITATADAGAGITFTGTNTIFANANGSSYTQEGGVLNASGASAATGDFGDGTMDITLKDVATTVTNLYANDLTIQGGSAAASTGNIGSKPAHGQVTTVTLTGTTVTASKIGAFGAYEKTFTKVTETSSSLSGILVQDHYRITYDVKGTGFNTDKLEKVLRTEQAHMADGTLGALTITPADGVPGKPENDKSNIFAGWYINQDGKRTALVKEGEPLPAGLTARTTLLGTTIETADTKDVAVNADGTKTLTVHVWLLATGTTSIKEGRVFADFTDGNSSVTIQTNQAWTTRLASTGTSIQGRDYMASFSQPLPAGTKLTLTVPKTADSAGQYYYYTVPDGGISSVKFSQFTVMGGTSKFQTKVYTDNAPEQEVFLLSADFAGTKITQKSSRNITFTLLPDSEGTSSINMGTKVSYSYTSVTQGAVTARVDSAGGRTTLMARVSALPTDSANLTGQNLYLMAELKTESGGDVSVSYSTKAKWNNQEGIWISKDKVLFPVSEATSSQTVTFTDLPGGTYTINWCLVYGKDSRGNIAGNKVSNTASITYTNTVLTDRPLLDVVLNPKVDSYVIPQGTQTKLQFHLETSCNQSETDKVVSITIEKQGTLCNFTPVDKDSTDFVVWEGTLTHQATTSIREDAVTFTSAVAAGTYRICFSMDPDSTEDNVYFTFIVK